MDHNFSGAYKEWLEREVKKGYSKNDLIPTLKYFKENQVRFEEKDITKWDGKALEEKVKELSLSGSKSKTRRGEYKKLFENDDYTIIQLMDKQSAVFWGKGTRWCITMEDATHYEEYIANNIVFFVIIDRKAKPDQNGFFQPESKVALAVYREGLTDEDLCEKVGKIEYYLADDSQRTFENLPVKIRELLEIDEESVEKVA